MTFVCKLCGQELHPRKFMFEEDVYLWGIFDNCTPFKEQLVYQTEKEALEAWDE